MGSSTFCSSLMLNVWSLKSTFKKSKCGSVQVQFPPSLSGRGSRNKRISHKLIGLCETGYILQWQKQEKPSLNEEKGKNWCLKVTFWLHTDHTNVCLHVYKYSYNHMNKNWFKNIYSIVPVTVDVNSLQYLKIYKQ